MDKMYGFLIGIGIAVLMFSIFAGLNSLLTPVFAGSGAQIASATNTNGICNATNGWVAETLAGNGTGMNCAMRNATLAYGNTNQASGVIFPLLPYIGIAGGLVLLIFGKPLSALVGQQTKF